MSGGVPAPPPAGTGKGVNRMGLACGGVEWDTDTPEGLKAFLEHYKRFGFDGAPGEECHFLVNCELARSRYGITELYPNEKFRATIYYDPECERFIVTRKVIQGV